MRLIKSIENIFGDNIAYLKHYDFSRANESMDMRVLAVTTVASICYNNKKAIGAKSLFNRLEAESKGLPSSSFEFVPMLFKYTNLLFDIPKQSCGRYGIDDTNMLKYGIQLVVDGVRYLLTNYRAVVYDYENLGIDFRDMFNTLEYEQKIIYDNYKVFLMYIDMPTRSQVIRHRANPQELSRRYVSGKRVEYDFLITDKMKKVEAQFNYVTKDNHTIALDVTMQQAIDVCMSVYNKALSDGVKPEEARRIIPQAGYTSLWMGFQKPQLDNFFTLRLDEHAQGEIRKLAGAMNDVLN